MKNLFTKPEDCFSRQEATSVFRERGKEGPIDLGCAYTSEGNYVVWHCHTQEQEIAFSIFKDLADKELPEIKSFTAFRINDIFSTGGNFYYIDQYNDLQRIDIFFDASLAASIYEMITDILVEDIQIGLVYSDITEDDNPMCCWIFNGNRILPIFKDDFALIEGNINYHFTSLQPGNIFEHSRMFWQIEDGENGLEIAPLCVIPNPRKKLWSNFS